MAEKDPASMTTSSNGLSSSGFSHGTSSRTTPADSSTAGTLSFLAQQRERNDDEDVEITVQPAVDAESGEAQQTVELSGEAAPHHRSNGGDDTSSDSSSCSSSTTVAGLLNNTVAVSDSLLRQRVKNALMLSFAADALCMPAHYFSSESIHKTFRPYGIAKMEAPPEEHPATDTMVETRTRAGVIRTPGSSIGTPGSSLNSSLGLGDSPLSVDGTLESRKSSVTGLTPAVPRIDTDGGVVGGTILKGKRRYWGIPKMHYHQGMSAGENTLNAYCARLVLGVAGGTSVADVTQSQVNERRMTTLAEVYPELSGSLLGASYLSSMPEGDASDPLGYSSSTRSVPAELVRTFFNREKFLNDYVSLMTAHPPIHPDTFADVWHRDFFACYREGVPLGEIPHVAATRVSGANPDYMSIGLLATLPAIASYELLTTRDVDRSRIMCVDHLSIFTQNKQIFRAAEDFVSLLFRLLFRPPTANEHSLKKVFHHAGKTWARGGDVARLARLSTEDLFGSKGHQPVSNVFEAFPAVLVLAYKYRESPELGLMVNANAGGDNVHRGILLGCLLGALAPVAAEASPTDQDTSSEIVCREFVSQLRHARAIEREVDLMLDAALDERRTRNPVPCRHESLSSSSNSSSSTVPNSAARPEPASFMENPETLAS